jgi:hypothetical protein
MRRRVCASAYLVEALLLPVPVLTVLALVALCWPGPLHPIWPVLGLLIELGIASATYSILTARSMPAVALLLNAGREWLGLGIWVLGWFVQRIEWRGSAYRVGQGSRLEPVVQPLAEGWADET